MKECQFKTLDEVLEKHPKEFATETIDSIPLNLNYKKSDKFIEEIDTHGSIRKYTKSVLNPVSDNMKILLSSANETRKELGTTKFVIDLIFYSLCNVFVLQMSSATYRSVLG